MTKLKKGRKEKAEDQKEHGRNDKEKDKGAC
jgi:hypothetical protein